MEKKAQEENKYTPFVPIYMVPFEFWDSNVTFFDCNFFIYIFKYLELSIIVTYSTF